mgnify:CR=1 FL=1|tara:strand:+ start:659 stop:832 length:174 start_codon:yes stop_codon:yes gene_type:complete
MRIIRLSNRNFKRFEKFTKEFIKLRKECILNTKSPFCRDDLSNHVMFDVLSAIERAD